MIIVTTIFDTEMIAAPIVTQRIPARHACRFVSIESGPILECTWPWASLLYALRRTDAIVSLLTLLRLFVAQPLVLDRYPIRIERLKSPPKTREPPTSSWLGIHGFLCCQNGEQFGWDDGNK